MAGLKPDIKLTAGLFTAVVEEEIVASKAGGPVAGGSINSGKVDADGVCVSGNVSIDKDGAMVVSDIIAGELPALVA